MSDGEGQHGPCSRAYIVATGVLIPTTGVVQSMTMLSLVEAAPRMFDLLRRGLTASPHLREAVSRGQMLSDNGEWARFEHEAKTLLRQIEGQSTYRSGGEDA